MVQKEFGLDSFIIRQALEGDWTSVCALNLHDEQFTSPMDRFRLGSLAQWACFYKLTVVDDVVAGFIIAMNDDAPYENQNFAWFKQRYSNFIYVDRIVISRAHRKLNLATALYSSLIDFATIQGKSRLVCEYNLSPWNEASARFHLRMGFREVGSRSVETGTKTVSMQLKDL